MIINNNTLFRVNEDGTTQFLVSGIWVHLQTNPDFLIDTDNLVPFQWEFDDTTNMYRKYLGDGDWGPWTAVPPVGGSGPSGPGLPADGSSDVPIIDESGTVVRYDTTINGLRTSFIPDSDALSSYSNGIGFHTDNQFNNRSSNLTANGVQVTDATSAEQSNLYAGFLEIANSDAPYVTLRDAGGQGGSLRLQYKFEDSSHRVGFGTTGGVFLLYAQSESGGAHSYKFTGTGVAEFSGPVSVAGEVKGRVPVSDHSTDTTLLLEDSGTLYTNQGATAPVTLTLPSGEVGVVFEFLVLVGQTLSVTAPSGSQIQNGATQGQTLSSSAVGSTVRIVAVSQTEWVVLSSLNGPWAL